MNNETEYEYFLKHKDALVEALAMNIMDWMVKNPEKAKNHPWFNITVGREERKYNRELYNMLNKVQFIKGDYTNG